MTQIIVRMHPDNEISPLVDNQLLADPAFMRANWAAIVIVPSGSSNPAIFAKATGAVEMLRGNSAEVAIAYYHLRHGGLLQVFVRVDSQGVKQKFGYPYLSEHPLWLDDEKDFKTIDSFLSSEKLQLFFVAPGEDGPCTGYFGLENELPIDCREFLKRELLAMRKYHGGIHNRNFDLCLQQYNSENPLEQSPILQEQIFRYTVDYERQPDLPPNAICPYCRETIEKGRSLVCCNECLTIHHSECWSETNRCTVFGCLCSKARTIPQSSDAKRFYWSGMKLADQEDRKGASKEEVLQVLIRGLQQNPVDQELLELRGWSEFDLGLYQEAEATLSRLLKLHPRSDEGRKLWKQMRRVQGKELVLDISENKKMEIYRDYKESCDRAFVQKYVPEKSEKADLDFNEVVAQINRLGSEATAEVRKRILKKYDLSEFDLNLILQEGERNAWPLE